MKKGDITKLAEEIGVSKSTIYRRAKKFLIDLSVKTISRDENTTDMFTGLSPADEYKNWFNQTKGKLS